MLVGGGLGSQRCAETLRREGYAGAIRIVCAEPHPPYDRPPLSKALLTGSVTADALSYHTAAWYHERDVDLLIGTAAVSLRLGERSLALSDGSSLRYEKLLVATGARPRMLPQFEFHENVSVLRTLNDAVSLREVLTRGPRLAIVGGGFIGLEVAATARHLGIQTNLIEADRAPLNAVLGPVLADWFRELHESEGVRVHAGVTVNSVIGEREATALVLSDGTTVETDHVLVGVGVRPAVSWLEDSGLATATGVLADADGRTGASDVFAVGDAAATWHAEAGRHLPGSHWEAAARQATRAAQRMLGRSPRPSAPPSFWSDQYGLRIQYVGHRGAEELLRIDRSGDPRSFIAWFGRADLPVAAVLVNRPRELPAARTAIGRSTHELSGTGR